MASMTMIEYAKRGKGTVVQNAIINTFARTSMILEVLPFRNISGNALQYGQEKALPGVAFRGINEGYVASHGTVNNVTESLKIAGGDLIVDKFLVDTEGTDVRATQEAAQLKSLSAAFQTSFFKGDSASNPNDMDGLQSRLGGTQLLANSAAGSALTLDNLDTLIDLVESPTHLIMNKAMRRKLTSASRSTGVAGFIITQQDAFGRPVSFYADLPIIAIEDLAGQDTALPFSELSPDGTSNSDCTSIYCVSFGPGMLEGIQRSPMEARDLGEMDSRPALLTRVEWYPSVTVYHPRAAARLHGVRNLPVVA